MSMSVHQISPKPLPLESRNSHIVHVLPQNDQTHFKTNFTVHLINFTKNNLANRGPNSPRGKSSPPFVFGFRFVDNLVLPSGRSIWVAYSITFIYIITPLLTSTHKPCWHGTPLV